MPGGALLQLVAHGAQDSWLVGRPDISFFKLSTKKHSNFALEDIMQTENGGGAWGGRSTFIVSRNGDLLCRAMLEIVFQTPTSSSYGYVSNPGLAMIDHIDLECGGQKIDTLYGTYMDIRNQLHTPKSKTTALTSLLADGDASAARAHNYSPGRVYVYLPFFFSKQYGSALPLIALQYHQVQFVVHWKQVNEVARNLSSGTFAAFTGSESDVPFPACSMYCTYAFLDTVERRSIASRRHEFLIEQIQFTGTTSYTPAPNQQIQHAINLNHPVKEILIVFPTVINNTGDVFNYGAVPSIQKGITGLAKKDNSPFSKVTLMLNGHDRQSERPGSFYETVAPFYSHTTVSMKNISQIGFALSPEKLQPSGSCNFSRIDNAQLKLTYSSDVTTDARQLHVYAVNYNVLVVVSGMCGVSFSN